MTGSADPAAFAAPDQDPIRARYRADVTAVEGRVHDVAVVAAAVPGQRHEAVVGRYQRNYPLLDTFEPFRQWRGGRWHDYALISANYTLTAVMDLATGQIVAEESEESAAPGMPLGFCPVEFHVPDYWDSRRDGYGPQDPAAAAQPDGRWGLVAGCHWGDDAAWKIQYLDLSRVHDGVITRDDRFGYLELPARLTLAEAVHYWPGSGQVRLAIAADFSLADGSCAEGNLNDPGMRNWRRPGEPPA